jgi:hypothetical protein
MAVSGLPAVAVPANGLEQRLEVALLQVPKRGLARLLVRGQVRLLLIGLLQGLEQGLLRAKALPLPSGGRPKGRDEGKEGGGSKWVMTQ